MNLHVIRSKKFKTTVICLLIRQALEREHATINAIIPNILARGSKKYPGISQMNSALEKMSGSVFGAQVVKKGEEQIIQLYIEFIADNEPIKLKALEFLNEILLHPLIEGNGFKKEYVEDEKINLKLAIESRINNKSEYAKLRCLEEMCKGERFGVYADGYAEDIDALTPESIYARYTDALKSGVIELVVLGLGNEGEKLLQRQIDEIFNFPISQPDELPEQTTAFERRELRRIEENSDITQGKICLGFRTGVPNTGAEFYKTLVMNEALGGSASSKLFINIREKENLCYYINSFVYRSKGILFIQSGVEDKSFDRVIELVLEQIEAVKQSKITEAEFSNAKKSLIKRMQGIMDYQAGYLDFYVSQLMLGDVLDINDPIGYVRNVCMEDLPQSADKLFFDTVFMLRAGENNG